MIKLGVVSDIENNTFKVERSFGSNVCFFVPNKEIRTIKTSQNNTDVVVFVLLKDGTTKTVNHASSTTITVTQEIVSASVCMWTTSGNADGRVCTVTLS